MGTVKKIVILGNPNVGKSVIFNDLTGRYVTVSNYPGTTVEVYKGKTKIGKTEYEVIDTPGMYSLLTVTDEERVSREIILNEKPDVVIHVIDAKNLERMLPFTIQLMEAKLPLILVLNIMDEAERLDIKIDIKRLEEELGIAVISVVGITKKGIGALKNAIENYSYVQPKEFNYDAKIQTVIKDIVNIMKGEYTASKEIISSLLVQGDAEIDSIVKQKEHLTYKKIKEKINGLKNNYPEPLSYIVALRRQRLATDLVLKCVKTPKEFVKDFKETMSRVSMHPLFGYLILFVVLYFGLYKFVGGFGAGTLVDFLEKDVFGYIIPPISWVVKKFFPWEIIQDLFINEYGLFTLGLRYAVAIIFPIVGTFFLVFAVIEDTGYLPRLAMLIDKVFKLIGLSGRAVIPMVLGLGCDTMATMVTRTLPTTRERIIASILLSLAIPCSAQLGIILGMLANKPVSLSVWISIISFIFLIVGFLSSKILPGEKSIFFIEVPPLRIPKISNILIKTYSRMEWYFKEIFPLFIIASFLIWIGRIIGLFDLLINLLSYPLSLIGLPKESAAAYIFGFFRRDYGAAGLYDLNKNGLLTGNQLLVSIVVMTLFLPCIAQFLITIKERGWKVGVSISVFVFVFAFFVGYLLNLMLNIIGVTL